jgi:hypothetical protein
VNLERDPLPEGEWDAIFAPHVLHRVADPERLLHSMHDALGASGRVILSEFVGADASRDLLRRYVQLLPIGLRFDPDTGLPLPREPQPSNGRAGPGALSLARAVFVEEAAYRGGGGLLQPLLFGFEERLAAGADHADRLLAVLGAAEEDLHARGLVADAFAIFVGRRRAESRMT